VSKHYVIVNADDFGQSPGVNRGVVQAHERGIVTSASLMVRHPHAAQAADYARQTPALGVGLHFDLGEWILRAGDWVPLYEVADLSNSRAIAGELDRQCDLFVKLLKRPPTHIDSHQHKHLHEPVRSIVCEVAQRYGIPVRGVTIPYCGRFYGQDENGVSYPDWIAVPALVDILGSLETSVSEIGCHPATENDVHTMYGSERITELATLCNPLVREAISCLEIILISYANELHF
jgi:predicted glycoside hydrolase/deacetylase ChbG (UPF0249 family)